MTPEILENEPQRERKFPNQPASIANKDFEPAERGAEIHALSRPSLSYWQDAWIRLKKNKQAMISGLTVLGLALFVTVGPWIWTIDPAYQDLNRVSEEPNFQPIAIALKDLEPFVEKISNETIETPTENVAGIQSPSLLKVMAIPTTQSVRLEWDAVTGAAGYTIYRNEVVPLNGKFGVPIADVVGGNKISFEDTASLELRTYYYTLVSKNLNGEESIRGKTLPVNLVRTVQLEQARELQPNLNEGDKVTLRSTPMGSDSLGRDILARLMFGGRISLFIGFFTSLLWVAAGVFIGGISGFVGGKIDTWIMRTTDFVTGLPFLLFMILLKVVLSVGPGESGISALLVALVILSWTGTARLVRGQVLQLRNSDFVQAARLLGSPSFHILIRHILPNLLGIILVSLTFGIPSAIFTEAFLSFIGLGVASPATSWGAMCTEGVSTLLTHPHEFIFPAVFISLTVLSFNLFGDGLRDALDPRLRST